MNVAGKHYRTIWLKTNTPEVVHIIDQRLLPHEFRIVNLRTVDEVAYAIKEMLVRGAGLIGATAGFGMYIAALQAPRTNRDDFLASIMEAGDKLKATRPTAVNLEWAVERQKHAIVASPSITEMIDIALHTAQTIANEDADFCRRIGEHGLSLIQDIAAKKQPGEPVNILTHCNAGWLAFVDYGTATSPIYAAHDRGIPVHVWVDETRPRNQGARLTAWELGQHGVPHAVIADNVGGHLMQHGQVDMVIVGSDRTTYTGDVANKIGTYLKALAAHDNDVPFYVALPSSTFDWTMQDGLHDIPIEQRNGDEVRHIFGRRKDGVVDSVLLTPEESPVANYAFDVTPARLVTSLITERGICSASAEGIGQLYPDKMRMGKHAPH